MKSSLKQSITLRNTNKKMISGGREVKVKTFRVGGELAQMVELSLSKGAGLMPAFSTVPTISFSGMDSPSCFLQNSINYVQSSVAHLH